MESIKFNLTGIKNIFIEAIQRKEPTLSFEIKQGRGLFNFLMFFSEEDKDSKDRLFIYLRNTNVFIQFKLYGSHKKGDFYIYIDQNNRDKIINELDLKNHNNTFDFNIFLEKLNNSFPDKLSLEEKIVNIREIWTYIKKEIPNIIDECTKTILYGIKKLPKHQKPQEKTLRKLYIYTNSDPETIRHLIDILKRSNRTVAWTNDFDRKGKSIVEIISEVNNT